MISDSLILVTAFVLLPLTLLLFALFDSQADSRHGSCLFDFFLFVPKAYACFHRWKATHHSLYFLLMTLLGLVALYLWSLLSLGLIFMAMGW
jgi:hypothetical protein